MGEGEIYEVLPLSRKSTWRLLLESLRNKKGDICEELYSKQQESPNNRYEKQPNKESIKIAYSTRDPRKTSKANLNLSYSMGPIIYIWTIHNTYVLRTFKWHAPS